jgi:hypothetical protein
LIHCVPETAAKKPSEKYGRVAVPFRSCTSLEGNKLPPPPFSPVDVSRLLPLPIIHGAKWIVITPHLYDGIASMDTDIAFKLAALDGSDKIGFNTETVMILQHAVVAVTR